MMMMILSLRRFRLVDTMAVEGTLDSEPLQKTAVVSAHSEDQLHALTLTAHTHTKMNTSISFSARRSPKNLKTHFDRQESHQSDQSW